MESGTKDALQLWQGVMSGGNLHDPPFVPRSPEREIQESRRPIGL